MPSPRPPDPDGRPDGTRGEAATGDARAQRWILIRDLLIFVSKAGLEAVRDIALIPAALIAGIAGLLLSPSKPDRYFLRVLEVGDEFDDFVDLFGKEKRLARGSRFDRPEEEEELLRADDIFNRIEKAVVDEYKRGGVTAQAKQAIDRGLDAVQDALASPPALPPPDKPTRGDPDAQ
ncbi:MAG: hypothetical protein CL910_19220 [Deltaproteobacteria bacterium]|jgi:hypothetical protein|nr:hypothetical protein [Deltaproteobacteria bacterium]